MNAGTLSIPPPAAMPGTEAGYLQNAVALLQQQGQTAQNALTTGGQFAPLLLSRAGLQPGANGAFTDIYGQPIQQLTGQGLTLAQLAQGLQQGALGGLQPEALGALLGGQAGLQAGTTGLGLGQGIPLLSSQAGLQQQATWLAQQLGIPLAQAQAMLQQAATGIAQQQGIPLLGGQTGLQQGATQFAQQQGLPLFAQQAGLQGLGTLFAQQQGLPLLSQQAGLQQGATQLAQQLGLNLLAQQMGLQQGATQLAGGQALPFLSSLLGASGSQVGTALGNLPLAQQYQQRAQAALSGQLPVDPALVESLNEQRRQFEEQARQQWGPGYQSATPYQNAKYYLDLSQNNSLEAARRQDIATAMQGANSALGGAQQGIASAFSPASYLFGSGQPVAGPAGIALGQPLGGMQAFAAGQPISGQTALAAGQPLSAQAALAMGQPVGGLQTLAAGQPLTGAQLALLGSPLGSALGVAQGLNPLFAQGAGAVSNIGSLSQPLSAAYGLQFSALPYLGQTASQYQFPVSAEQTQQFLAYQNALNQYNTQAYQNALLFSGLAGLGGKLLTAPLFGGAAGGAAGGAGNLLGMGVGGLGSLLGSATKGISGLFSGDTSSSPAPPGDLPNNIGPVPDTTSLTLSPTGDFGDPEGLGGFTPIDTTLSGGGFAT